MHQKNNKNNKTVCIYINIRQTFQIEGTNLTQKEQFIRKI